MFNMYNINDNVKKDNDEYFEYYTIKKGDTIYQLARKYNINPNLLMLLNGLELNDYIYPNQIILLPKKNFSYYITKEGDTLSTVATTFNTSIPKLLMYNQTVYLTEGQLIVNKNK